MKTLLTLSEKVKITHTNIIVPKSLKYAEGRYATTIEKIVDKVEQINDEKDDAVYKCELLASALTSSLQMMDEIVQKTMEQKYNHNLELKKKDYVIRGFKSFLADKENLDKETPSVDDTPDDIDPDKMSPSQMMRIAKKLKV